MSANGGGERGFTLIEVLLSSALFVFVAMAGFEVLRQLSWNVDLLAQRTAAAAQVEVAAGMLRSAALSSVAIWKPASACGDAVEFMQRDANGTQFLLFVARGTTLERTGAAGPLNPCDPALQLQPVIASVAGFSVTRIPASALPQHADPITADADGGLFLPGGITAVAADAHANDAAGAPILSGNDIVEVTIDTEPAVTSIDLLAGNRPSGYTQVLTYACNGRCEAGAPFPEIRSGAFTDCVPGYDFADSATYYVPASFGFSAGANGTGRIVVTAYSVTGGYTFAFAGPAPVTAERAWTPALWPPAGSPLAGTIADPYPVDYGANAVRARGVAQLAADLGVPQTFAPELTACADMHADVTFNG